VAIYDWSNEDPAISKLSWTNYEYTLTEKHKEFMYFTICEPKNRNETSIFGTSLLEIVLINPKILGPLTVDEVLASFKRNMNVDFKYFFVVFRGIDGFSSSMKKYFLNSRFNKDFQN